MDDRIIIKNAIDILKIYIEDDYSYIKKWGVDEVLAMWQSDFGPIFEDIQDKMIYNIVNNFTQVLKMNAPYLINKSHEELIQSNEWRMVQMEAKNTINKLKNLSK